MNEKIERIIVEATKEVFEQMAFLEVLEEGEFENEAPPLEGPSSEETEKGSNVQIQSTLAFKGRFEGTISVAYSQKLARILASNMLGLDEDEINIPEDVVDSVREVTNMISGGILTRLTLEGEPVDLSVPTVGMVDNEDDFVEDESAIVVKFDAEGERVLSKMMCSSLDMF